MTTTLPDLAEKIKQFDRAEAAAMLEVAKQQRAEVLREFPREQWPELPLERYALGLGTAVVSYCR